MERLWTQAEVAEYLRCSEKFVQKEIRDGNLKAKSIAGGRRISEDALREYLDARDADGPSPSHSARGKKGGRPRREASTK